MAFLRILFVLMVLYLMCGFFVADNILSGHMSYGKPTAKLIDPPVDPMTIEQAREFVKNFATDDPRAHDAYRVLVGNLEFRRAKRLLTMVPDNYSNRNRFGREKEVIDELVVLGKECRQGTWEKCREIYDRFGYARALRVACDLNIMDACVDYTHAMVAKLDYETALATADQLCRSGGQCDTKKLIAREAELYKECLTNPTECHRFASVHLSYRYIQRGALIRRSCIMGAREACLKVSDGGGPFDQHACNNLDSGQACTRVNRKRIPIILAWPIFLILPRSI